MSAHYGVRSPSGRVFVPGPSVDEPTASLRALVTDDYGLALVCSVDGGPWEPATLAQLEGWAASDNGRTVEGTSTPWAPTRGRAEP